MKSHLAIILTNVGSITLGRADESVTFEIYGLNPKDRSYNELISPAQIQKKKEVTFLILVSVLTLSPGLMRSGE